MCGWSNFSFLLVFPSKVTDLLTLLETQLVLAPGLKVVKSHEELGVPVLVLAANQEIFPRGPAEAGALERVEEAEAGQGGEVILGGGRNLRQRTVL